ncbi:putative CAP20-virulence factor [Coleophoma crateriformis]|uniref:Putative CAP20-virulence factor n=1 Tax=Coleophoma crateriformis TaxID=565419 RepID=A0A3D8R308_9HELO|nr:putative CAP20-virulence factor [Coleophoma crateriformis]
MTQVNGETPSSAFLNHLTSYPVVSDSITTFKSHPIGKKTLNISATSYDKFGKPVMPYFKAYYSKFSPYIIPYAKKADSIGDNTLNTIDSKFPTIKKSTEELYEEGKGFVFLPLKLSMDGKDYVFKTFNTEKKNVGAEGIVGYGKAALATGLVVSSDTLSWISSFLSKKKTEVKEVANEKMNN